MEMKIAKLINYPKKKKVKNNYSLEKIQPLASWKPIKNHITPQHSHEIRSNNKAQANIKSQACKIKKHPAH